MDDVPDGVPDGNMFADAVTIILDGNGGKAGKQPAPALDAAKDAPSFNALIARAARSKVFEASAQAPNPAPLSSTLLKLNNLTGFPWKAGNPSIELKSPDLSQFKVYPNPFRPGGGSSYDASGVTFAGLTRDAKAAIFTLAGEKVRELDKDDESDAILWDTKNAEGQWVARGVYIYQVTNAGGETRRGRVAIIR